MKNLNQTPIVSALLCLCLLSACAGKDHVPMVKSPSPTEVRHALEQPTPEKKVSALKELHPSAWPVNRAIDLQSAITFFALETDPRTIQDRESFLKEAGVLGSMLESKPIHLIPEDAAVLLYLSGYPNKNLLSAKVASSVDEFCSPTLIPVGAMKGETLNQQAIKQARSELASSCYHYVEGDSLKSQVALSNALKWQLITRSNVFPNTINPSLKGGWDIFKARLEKETGIRLEAAVSRLIN